MSNQSRSVGRMGIGLMYHNLWHAKVVEPIKRNKDGLRWISHRFPIKGGISWREAMLIDASKPNPFYQRELNKLRQEIADL